MNLFKDVRIHSIFNISLLKLIDLNTLIQETFHYEKQKEEKFEIEKILKEEKGQYLIKWKKYDATKNIWELVKNLANCQKLLRQFRTNWKSHQVNVST